MRLASAPADSFSGQVLTSLTQGDLADASFAVADRSELSIPCASRNSVSDSGQNCCLGAPDWITISFPPSFANWTAKPHRGETRLDVRLDLGNSVPRPFLSMLVSDLRVASQQPQSVFTRLQRKWHGPAGSVRIEYCVDHLYRTAALIDIAHGLAVFADRLDQIAASGDVAEQSGVALDWLGLADAGAGNRLPLLAAAARRPGLVLQDPVSGCCG